MRFLFLGIISLALLSSCVPNRKITMLQHNDLHKKSTPIDTVVRSYQLDTFAYKVQANDILSIRFEAAGDDKYNFLKQEIPMGATQVVGGALLIGELVDESGNVAFPSIGKIKVAGMTVFQIERKLQEVANQYLDGPTVKVRLLNFRFTMLGEVNKEGTITFNNNRVSLLEAIGQAGGFTDLADRSRVKLVRSKNGVTEVLYVNLLDENFLQSPYYYIHQNDAIIVPPLRQKPFLKYFGQNMALLVSTVSLILVTINLTK